MIIYRFHTKKGYSIQDSKGNEIKDATLLNYVENLVIPPAYQDVKIFVEKAPKILYEGFDSKGRKQQIYSAAWRKKQDKKKFESLIHFGKTLPKIRQDILKHIKKPNSSLDKMISLIIRIISLCYFRVGNLKYQKLYGSFGISNILRKHLVEINKKYIKIEFIGKKGVHNECMVTDPLIVAELTNLAKEKKSTDYMFSFYDNETKEISAISAKEINNWLKSYDENFTSKMFRTYDTNVLLIEFLNNAHRDPLPKPTQVLESHRKKNIVNAMKEISEKVNNTPAICKKSYANDELIDIYINHPKKFERDLMNGSDYESLFIKFLKSISSE